VLLVRQPRFVLALHVVSLHIISGIAGRMAAAIKRMLRAAGGCHEQQSEDDPLSSDHDGETPNIGCCGRQDGLPPRMISAHRFPLTIALSMLAGQPVSVQAPPIRRLLMGLC